MAKTRILPVLFISSYILLCCWTAVISSCYRRDFELFFFSYNCAPTFFQSFSWSSAERFFSFPAWPIKAALLPVLISGCLIWSWAIRRFTLAVRFACLTTVAFVIYAAASLSNTVRQESITANHLAAGLYKNSVIASGPEMNLFFENAGTLQRALKYQTIRQNEKRKEQVRIALDKYVTRARNQIIRDPSGFAETLLPSREVYLDDSHWSDF